MYLIQKILHNIFKEGLGETVPTIYLFIYQINTIATSTRL